MYVAYDMKRDTLVGSFASKKNAVTFLAFLKQLRCRYRRDEPLHIVLDNGTYHGTEEVLRYAANHKIRFYWTLTDASWLNRVECHLRVLKRFALENTDYRSHREQQQAIET